MAGTSNGRWGAAILVAASIAVSVAGVASVTVAGATVAPRPGPAVPSGRGPVVKSHANTFLPCQTVASSGPWRALNNLAPFRPGAMLLLTDGSVLVHDEGAQAGGTPDWWRLRPNKNGSYVKGTWSQVASLPSTYGPSAFASAVLPDGRVIIEGGEFNNGFVNPPTLPPESNEGAIYDPVTNTWKMVAPPSGWTTIGDAPSVVLANGKFMLGQAGSFTNAQALLNATTSTWTPTGTGKADANPEEGWTLLPNGDVLTVDTQMVGNSEIYLPGTGTWSTAGPMTPLIDQHYEMGPQVLRPDGTVIAFGANGSNAIYDSTANTWSPGPSFPTVDDGMGPMQYAVSDGPASILPNGKVLVDASPGYSMPPAHFFVFDGTTLTQVADSPLAPLQASDYGYMLVLPTGNVLFNFHYCQMYVYNNGGSPQASWRPQITTVPTTLAAGGTYTVSGQQLNGLTQGAAFGDDVQSATNYPLVRIKNSATGHVFYARTSGMTSMSVARAPNAASSAKFRVPPDIELGHAKLVVVANGISSTPKSVTITCLQVTC